MTSRTPADGMGVAPVLLTGQRPAPGARMASKPIRAPLFPHEVIVMLARVFLFGSLAALAIALALALALMAWRAAPAEAMAGEIAESVAAPLTPTPASAPVATTTEPMRLICVGGALTEIVFALGAGDHVLAVDDGSGYPLETGALPKLGYQRALSAEGLLARGPDMLLASPEAGPPTVLAQLRAAGVAVNVIPTDFSLAGAETMIAAVAQALHRPAQGEALLAALRADVAHAQQLLKGLQDATPPRVLCIYARGRGTLHACGAHTAMDAMVSLAGGVNALASLSGSAPLGGEAAVAAAPDVILLPRGSAEVSGGETSLLQEAGLALTPAGRAGRVVLMDDQLLVGFGPRTGQALAELVRALHAEPAASGRTDTSGR